MMRAVLITKWTEQFARFLLLTFEIEGRWMEGTGEGGWRFRSSYRNDIHSMKTKPGRLGFEPIMQPTERLGWVLSKFEKLRVV